MTPRAWELGPLLTLVLSAGVIVCTPHRTEKIPAVRTLMSLGHWREAEDLCPSREMGCLQTVGECGSPIMCVSGLLFGLEGLLFIPALWLGSSYLNNWRGLCLEPFPPSSPTCSSFFTS